MKKGIFLTSGGYLIFMMGIGFLAESIRIPIITTLILGGLTLIVFGTTIIIMRYLNEKS